MVIEVHKHNRIALRGLYRSNSVICLIATIEQKAKRLTCYFVVVVHMYNTTNYLISKLTLPCSAKISGFCICF